MPPVPLFPTVTAAYRDVFGDVKGFLKATCLIWLLLIVCVQIPSEYLNERAQAEMKPQAAAEQVDSVKTEAPVAKEPGHIHPKTALMILGVNILQALIIFCFSIAWYRALLLHERRGKIIIPWLGKRELLYIWNNMKVSLIISPLFLVVAGIALGNGTQIVVTPGKGLLLGAVIYGMLLLQARLSLSYPLSAVDQNEAPLASSWHMANGNTNRIVFGNILIFVPQLLAMMLIISGIAWVVDAFGGVPAEGEDQSIIVDFALKSIGSYLLIFLLGTVSAFQARIYATLLKA